MRSHPLRLGALAAALVLIAPPAFAEDRATAEQLFVEAGGAGTGSWSDRHVVT
jgi:hypothetical protein